MFKVDTFLFTYNLKPCSIKFYNKIYLSFNLQVSIIIIILQYISASFWPMWLTDKTLVMPEHYDLYFPHWLNHVTHAHIFIFGILEMITTYREYPHRLTGLTIFIAFKLCYLIW